MKIWPQPTPEGMATVKELYDRSDDYLPGDRAEEPIGRVCFAINRTDRHYQTNHCPNLALTGSLRLNPTHRIPHQFGSALKVQLAFNIRAVRIHSLYAE